jgi:hypothetical protein
LVAPPGWAAQGCLRISQEPRVEAILRDLIIDAEKRLVKIEDEQLQRRKIPANDPLNNTQ